MTTGPDEVTHELMMKLDRLLVQRFPGLAPQPHVDDRRGEDWDSSTLKVWDGASPLALVPRGIGEAAVEGSQPDVDWIEVRVQAGIDALEEAKDWDYTLRDPNTGHLFGIGTYASLDRHRAGGIVEFMVKDLTAKSSTASVRGEGWARGEPTKADLQYIVDRAKVRG
jgi:hypothetical protein